MEDLNIGHGGEPAQASNASKTDAAATQQERHNMPDPGGREQMPATSEREQELRVAEEPSGYRGDNWATAGPGGTAIRSATPENAAGHINPSAPGDTGVTPNTTPHSS